MRGTYGELTKNAVCIHQSEKHFVIWVDGFPHAEEGRVPWPHHPQITVCSWPRMQSDNFREKQKCQFFSGFKMDSLAL